VNHVVMFSGGLGSWAAAKRVVERHGKQDVTLLFCDTLIEDEDLYRFLDEAAANVGAPLVRITDGRTPFQVFRDRRFLGNSRVDPCSEELKRNLADRWMKEHFTPENCVRYVGIDWSESHRFDRIEARLAPWKVEAPMCDAPYMMKPQIIDWLRQEGVEPPRLYALGFVHNNCSGTCVKAGQAQWKRLLDVFPERYADWERQEEEIREQLGKDVSILTDRAGGTGKRPLTLRQFRERVQAGHEYDLFDWGGCGCFSGPVDEGSRNA
jgi:hypothetical protein